MNCISDDIARVVSLIGDDTMNQPFYMFGHRSVINRDLLEKDKDRVLKYQKYPLVALRLDTPEQESKGWFSYTLNLAIIALTNKNYTSEERMTNVFKPVLMPIYDRLFGTLASNGGDVGAFRRSGLFSWSQDRFVPEHTRVMRPFWGTAGLEGNEKYIFSDPLDAIEILDLKVTRTSKNCN